MPGTPFLPTAAMEAEFELLALPHAGGDPELAAVRACTADVHVRVLPDVARVTKPACTVTVGTKRFELTDHQGRKPASRLFFTALSRLEADLPSGGWVDVPADPDAIRAHAGTVVDDYRRDGLARAFGSMGSPGGLLAALDVAASEEVRHEKRLDDLRDEYASAASAGTL